ncbi:hypothetical protein D3C72_1364840 [compost metagenome]
MRCFFPGLRGQQAGRHITEFIGAKGGRHDDGHGTGDPEGSLVRRALRHRREARFGKRGGNFAPHGRGRVLRRRRVDFDHGHQGRRVETHDLGVGAHETAHHGQVRQSRHVALFQRDHLARRQLELVGHLLHRPAQRFALRLQLRACQRQIALGLLLRRFCPL